MPFATSIWMSLEHLARVLEFAPGLTTARNGVAKIRQRQAIGRVQLAYETARAGGRLVSARAAVEAWGRLVDPDSTDLQEAWTNLAQQLRRAESLAARARNLERSRSCAARTSIARAWPSPSIFPKPWPD